MYTLLFIVYKEQSHRHGRAGLLRAGVAADQRTQPVGQREVLVGAAVGEGLHERAVLCGHGLCPGRHACVAAARHCRGVCGEHCVVSERLSGWCINYILPMRYVTQVLPEGVILIMLAAGKPWPMQFSLSKK